MLAFQEALVERLSARIVLKADVAPQERELRGLAVRTLASKPDAVYLTLLPPQSSLFTKQLRQLGFQGEFFAATQIENRAEIIAAGEAFEGLWYVKDGDTESIKFERRFFERYQTQPDNFASNAYDTLRLLIQALSQPNPTHALEGVTDFHGALGSYRALPDHSFSIPGMLRIIRNTKVNSLESNIAGSAFLGP